MGGVIGAQAFALVKDYFDKHGGIDGVVAELEKTGYGQQVKSWVGTGANLPISAEDIKQALGSEKLKSLAESTGIPLDKAAEYLAQHLPTAIDKATPDGHLPKA
nr:YidB family protein [uncultured Rhodoblastus sp.]